MRKLNVYLFFTLAISTFFLISCRDDGKILPIPEPPTNLVATVISETQIDLSWIDNSTSESAFRIERKSRPENYYYAVIAISLKDVNTYSDKTLLGNTSYSYRVNAINSALENSDYSNEVCGTTHGECDNNDDNTVKIMIGTWDVIEVKTDSTTLSNTGEKFTFFDCITPNNNFYGCYGIFETMIGVEQNFRWWIMGNTFGIYDYGNGTTLEKYYVFMQSVKLCAQKKLVFNYVNPSLTLEKQCSSTH